MFSRLRQSFWLLIAAIVGYLLGNGPFAEWVADVWNMLRVSWCEARSVRGPNGSFTLLIAGFLLGQGLFLMARRLLARVGPTRARRTERLASWDPSLQIPRRFGLHRYLEHCAKWAADDPSIRTPSLALFKIRGLGALNEEMGTSSATRLLQRISTEVRLSALPDTTSNLTHWLVRYLPRPLIPTGRGMPFPRYPARWSGSTFALAFRELDAVQAITVTRDLAAWIHGELDALKGNCEVSLVAGIAVGGASVTARGLAAAALESTTKSGSALLTVVYDESDLREPAILQLSDVAHQKVQMVRQDTSKITPETLAPDFVARTVAWLRTWGPGLGCFLACLALLQYTSSKGSTGPTYYVWPENLQELQIVDGTGSRKCRLLRVDLPSESAGGWTLSEGKIVQGDPADGPLASCQIHVNVTNSTSHAYYVSSYDFTPMDATGRKFTVDPTRMLLMDQGLAGRWMNPGESWSGWLVFPRRDAAITELVFEPDRFTRIVLKAMN